MLNKVGLNCKIMLFDLLRKYDGIDYIVICVTDQLLEEGVFDYRGVKNLSNIIQKFRLDVFFNK